MTDKEIIKALEHCSNDKVGLCRVCPLNEECNGDVTYLIGLALDIINRRKAEIEELKLICDKERADRLYLSQQNKAIIAGQETLQKALAEKNKEAAELNLDLKILREFDNCFKGNFGEIIEENKMLKNEVAELNSDLKLLKNNHEHLKTNFDETVEKNKRLRDKVVGLTAEKDRLIETFGECQAEAIKDFAKAVVDGIDEGYISHSSDIVDFTHNYLNVKSELKDEALERE